VSNFERICIAEQYFYRASIVWFVSTLCYLVGEYLIFCIKYKLSKQDKKLKGTGIA